MGTVVLCHKWLRKQGKLDVQINVFWLKGKKNIIKIQELTLSKVQLVTQQTVRCPKNHWDQQDAFKGMFKWCYSLLKFLPKLQRLRVLGWNQPRTQSAGWAHWSGEMPPPASAEIPSDAAQHFWHPFLDGAIPQQLTCKATWACKHVCRVKRFLH